MPSHPSPPARSAVVVPYAPDAPPPQLAPLAGPDRPGGPAVPERWNAVDRSAHAPHLVAVPGADATEWIAAALVTARPGTSYLKIVDALGDVPAAVGAVLETARRRGLAQVKWEGWTTTAEEATALGFTPLRTPPGAEGPDSGYIRRLYGAEPAAPPYYAQTTHFTCGAVTALVARAHAGALPGEALDRDAELTLWRAATNFPACEPVGLGVAVHRAWPSAPVTVFLDTEDPVLLDHLPEAEQEWRAALQRLSRADAERSGTPVDPRRLSLPEIRAALDRGGHVLLLVSLATLQGFDVPHWILCHGTVPGAVVVDDPWAHAPAGDTWVDAHLLPVPDASLDAMSVLSPARFRGAVHIAPASTGP
ncbi:peptidase C39 family protein [Streptomyces sp. NPDC093085]|uniref:peptidase C39 family protein n=1 Tax=Streptomyces sp. NPDC093085 TaxID=3155068 RepID=UPI0034236BAD